MLHESIVSGIHFMSVMVLFSALVAQHLLFTPRVSRETLRLLILLDAIYWAAALLVLASGLLKALYWGAGADYYLGNSVFHTKMTLFALVILLSTWPTAGFLRARRQVAGPAANAFIALPSNIRSLQRIELLCVLLMPLLAAFMARGFGAAG